MPQYEDPPDPEIEWNRSIAEKSGEFFGTVSIPPPYKILENMGTGCNRSNSFTIERLSDYSIAVRKTVTCPNCRHVFRMADT